MSMSIENEASKTKKLSQKTWFIILWLIVFFPVGLFLMWKSSWNRIIKIVLTVIIAIGVINYVLSPTPTAIPIYTPAEEVVQTETTTEEQQPSTPESSPEESTDIETTTAGETIPTEYKSALKKAERYSNSMHMSKAGIYNQLTSEYGEQFSAEAAQYAVDNMTADWNENALGKAKSYSNSMHMSKMGTYDQLTSEYGEQFTPEEAQYAVDHVDADWKANALEKAKSYQGMDMSPKSIHDQLTSQYGEKFTQEEADYAIANLN